MTNCFREGWRKCRQRRRSRRHKRIWFIPPLYYFLLKPAVAVPGSGVSALRFFSVMCRLVTVVLVARFGKYSPQLKAPAPPAAGIIAINEAHIYYSLGVRSYAFYTMLTAVLLLWALQVKEWHMSTRFWPLGTAPMTTMLYTHYVSSLFIGCAILAIRVTPLPKRARVSSVLAGLTAAVLFVPWLIAAAQS